MDGDAEGTPFGRYRLIEMLGRGGMGEVWRAYDTLIPREVALKVLPTNYADDPNTRERFRREAHKAASLNQRNVVTILDVGEVGGRLFVTMPIIEGRDLQTVLDDGPLPPQRAVAIVEQVAAALAAAHKAGLVHRDVKPSNILLTEDDFAYLIDFGIARAAGEAGLTSTGTTIGTWSYMSPERFRTGEIEPSSDTYALACVLYQCLTGELPFPGETLEQIAVAHMMAPLPKPSAHNPAVIPAALDDVIGTGMAKDPSARYRSTTDLTAAARAALTTVPDSPPPAREQQLLQTETTPELTPWEIPPPITPTSPVTLPATSVEPGRERTWVASAGEQTQPGTVWQAGVESPMGGGTAPVRSARRRRITLILAALGVAAVIAIVIVFVVVPKQHPQSTSGSRAQPSVSESQTVLPFIGLKEPMGVAVDGSGAVYVADYGNGRVVKLAAGSTVQTALPFTGVFSSDGVAVDATGAVYVANRATSRVDKLAAGSTVQTEGPFVGLGWASGIAVDGSDAVYVTDRRDSGGVIKLGAGSTVPTVLPFIGLDNPCGVAIDGSGAVYVADWGNNRVVKLAAGSTAQAVLPFTGLYQPCGVAVDGSGAVYVTDRTDTGRVVKLAAGSTAQTVLSFSGLNNPWGVAVDGSGAVYVVDGGSERVVKLQQR